MGRLGSSALKKGKAVPSLDLFNSFRGQEGSWCSLGSASLLTQECPDRAALTAPSSTETHAWWDLLLSEFCASEGDVPDPGECLYLLLLLS